MTGHTARVWDVAGSPDGELAASAAADGTVRLWQVGTAACCSVLAGHTGDVYSVQFHAQGKHVLSAGYDGAIRLFDAQTEVEARLFTGHERAVTQATFNRLGNLVISGSKDATIRVWDITSGLCIKTFADELDEISGIAVGRPLPPAAQRALRRVLLTRAQAGDGH